MARKIPNIVKRIQNNPPPEINYAFQKHVSYSQMSIYKQCPHRWKLQYKDKIKRFTSSIHTVFGTAIHEVIQEYLNVMYEKSKVKANEIDLDSLFQDKFTEEYQKQYKSNSKSHFSTAIEMREFFEDGTSILKEFKKNVGTYFSKKGTYLVGCEVPIVLTPNETYNNILYTGYLDVVLYNETLDMFEIIDIKTSTKGWNKFAKNDDMKKYQLLLYKQYFSEQYGIPLDKIEVKFFIVKRKIWEDTEYPMKRIQEFHKNNGFSQGKTKLRQATSTINDFIHSVFNRDGKIKEQKYEKIVSKWNCNFCPFSEDKELCGAGVVFQ